MNKSFFFLSFLMGVVVLSSNYLVQFPVKYYGLSGKINYPIKKIRPANKIISSLLHQEYKAVIKLFGNQYPMIANIDDFKLTFVSPCSGVTIGRTLSLEDEKYVSFWRES